MADQQQSNHRTLEKKRAAGDPAFTDIPYDKKAFRAYMTLYPVNGIRLQAGILVLFFLNVFLVIPVFSVPYEPLYAYILFPPLLVMNLWALALIAAPRRLQLNYVLFRGAFGIVCIVGFLIVTQKFAYSMLQLTSPWYAIVSTAIFGFAFYQYARNHILKLKAPSSSQKEHKTSRGLPASTLAMLSGLGYLTANISLMFISGETVTVVLMLVYGMLAFVMFHFIMELHRYYWLKRTASDPTAKDDQRSRHL
ncbi:hypothetical protein [Paenibacillus dakarensis]|uniref:hypothetical protein n=1 Tax=Paenibacillus dakarensis TaxID=1527293 RepID=UPI000B18871B|nr:hypothetical protein [Paenibacillus dakarensis]